MRVLAVTNAYPLTEDDSVGRFVKEQLDSLSQVGVDVEVLHVDRARRGARAYRDLGARVDAGMRSVSPDLLHVMYGGVMAAIVARSVRNVPLVISFCGSDLFGAGEAAAGRRLAARCGVHCSHRAARRADRIVVKSRALRDVLPDDIDRSRVVILPNGVDLARFVPLDVADCRRALGWEPRRKHVLFPACAARPEKRLWLAEAAVETLRGELTADVELHLLEGVPRAAVPTWLNASDAILLTSTHEGSPNVVKEALACNVAIVSVDVGDVAERVAGVAGCHVAEPTPDGLAAKLRLALAHGRTDGRRVVEHLSHERVAEQLRLLYEEVVGGRHRGRRETMVRLR